MTNPAGATVQVVGVYDPALVEQLAHVLGCLDCRPQELTGGDTAQNAAITLAVVQGQAGACRDTVLMNAGAALAKLDGLRQVATPAVRQAEQA